MLNQSQRQLVIKELEENGYVSRNWALRNFISRLGAIICDLNKDGYDLIGSFISMNGGKDYIYKKRFVPNNDWYNLDKKIR